MKFVTFLLKITFILLVCGPNNIIYGQNDNNWQLNQYVGSVIVINLPEAHERLEKIAWELQAIGTLEFEIFPAVVGSKVVSESLWKKFDRNWAKIDESTLIGQKRLADQHKAEAGCYLSHYLVVKMIKKRFEDAQIELQAAVARGDDEAILKALQKTAKYSSVLILEDDNGFGIVKPDKLTVTLTETGHIIKTAFEELPRDWELLYLMAGAKEPTLDHSRYLKQLVGRTICSNAYMIHYPIYESYIAHLGRIYHPYVNSVNPVDVEISKLHKDHQAFAIYPSIAYQNKGFSFIMDRTTQKLRQLQPVRFD